MCTKPRYDRPLHVTNFVYKLLFFFNTTCKFVFIMRLLVLSGCYFCFILCSIVFFAFSLYGAVISALRALLLPPRLLKFALYTCTLYLNFWVNKEKWRINVTLRCSAHPRLGGVRSNKSASILLGSQHWRCPLPAALWRRRQISGVRAAAKLLLLLSIDGTDRQTHDIRPLHKPRTAGSEQRW